MQQIGAKQGSQESNPIVEPCPGVSKGRSKGRAKGDTKSEQRDKCHGNVVTLHTTGRSQRHSGARRCEINVAREGGDVVVEVRDDGRGPGPLPHAGSGLPGLSERLALRRLKPLWRLHSWCSCLEACTKQDRRERQEAWLVAAELAARARRSVSEADADNDRTARARLLAATEYGLTRDTLGSFLPSEFLVEQAEELVERLNQGESPSGPLREVISLGSEPSNKGRATEELVLSRAYFRSGSGYVSGGRPRDSFGTLLSLWAKNRMTSLYST